MDASREIIGKPALGEELHCHTEESRFDSACSVREMVKMAASLGVKKMAITEHGVVTNADEFIAACREYGIDPVFGLEAYVRLAPDSLEGRGHMCLYAKSDLGRKAISETVTESFYHMEKEIPVMNAQILNKYFGEGSYGHGEVIASSACISGIICNILQVNERMNKEIAKLQTKLEKLSYVPISKNEVARQEKVIASITEEIESLKETAARKFAAKDRALAKMTGVDYEIMKSALEREKMETEKARQHMDALKEKKRAESKRLTKIRREHKESASKADQAKVLIQAIESCKKNMGTPEELKNRAKKMVLSYEKLFGKGNFYLEIQYHRTEEEKRIMPVIAEIARELDMPIVATNDAHMANGSGECIRAREIMRSLRYMNSKRPGEMWQEASAADEELYIKTEIELRSILAEIFDDETIDKAIAGRGKLLNQCHLNLNVGDHYPKFISEIEGETSEECLRRKTAEGVAWRFPDGIAKEYQEKVDYELDVICNMGFADYHLIVQDYMEYARYLGKYDHDNLPAGFEGHRFDKQWLKIHSEGMIGLGIGPGRGSAAGSRVCFILGITDIDPEKYNLVFERFLNPERVSMPDIDCDMATSIRNMVYDYVCHKYGRECVCHIMTKNRMKARASVDNASKLLGDKLHSDTTYFSGTAKKIKELIIEDELPDRSIIAERFKNDENALRIYDDAMLVNGVFKDYGMHAAGVVISDGTPVREHVPCMMDAKSGVMKTQCTMTQIEESHHLLKMDFLGLLSLDIITETLRMIEKNTGKKIDISKVPFENAVFSEIYAKGFTNGVFQVESSGMKQMMRQARPKTIEDIIILVSMYRPGPRDSLPKLLPVMAGDREADYLVPELVPILSATYGCIVYQEQVMQIVRDLAGYSYGRSDLVRRAMSKKKEDIMEAERQNFVYGNEEEGIKGCVNNGISEEAAYEIWDEMADFAKYAFNKSHAAAYSVVSYYTAWLKYHYPKEYIAAAMSHVNSGEKEKQSQKKKGYADDLRTLGISLAGPDINLSEVHFSIHDDKVYFGLGHISNVASKADIIVRERKENGSYRSLADFIYRTQLGGKVLENLIFSGAFDNIMDQGRQEMYNAVYDIAIAQAKKRSFDAIKIIRDKKRALAEADTEKKKENARKALSNVKDVLDTLYYGAEDDASKQASGSLDILLKEKEIMGIMLSGHPADDFGSEAENGCMKLSEVAVAENGSVMGQVTSLRIVRRKSDGRQMAFFNLDMPDGDIQACCFAKEYEAYSSLIKENAVIKISGKISEIEDDFSGRNEKILQIIVKTVMQLVPKQKEIIVYGNETTKEGWTEFRNRLSSYEAEGGFPLILFNLSLNRFQPTGLFVSKDILESPHFQAEM